MKPCLTLCKECKNYKIIDKKVKCDKEHFFLSLQEAMIAVPLDFECVDFNRSKVNFESLKG